MSPVPTVSASVEFPIRLPEGHSAEKDADIAPPAPVHNGPPYLRRAAPVKAPKPVRLVPKSFQPKPAQRKLPIGVLPGEFHRDNSGGGSWRIHHSDDPDLLQNPGTRYSSRLGKGTRAR